MIGSSPEEKSNYNTVGFIAWCAPLESERGRVREGRGGNTRADLPEGYSPAVGPRSNIYSKTT